MIKRFHLLTFFLFLLPLYADPTVQPENKPADEAEKPAEHADHLIRLDGLWEIHISGRNTGVELSIKQITERFHITFSKPPVNNPLGIKVGDNFLWGTLQGNSGDGNIFLVDEPDEPGGAVKRTQAPVRFQVNDALDRIRVEVDKEGLNAAMKRFEIVRIGRVESLRVYVKGPGNLQATNVILEDQHMIVEVKHSNPSPSPVEVTLKSGVNTLKLTARPEADKPGILRSDPFVATYANALGIQPTERAEPEPETGTELTKEDWKNLLGTWKVLYRDGALGDVTGWMHVDQYGQCDLQFTDPADDSTQSLKLVKARVRGTTTAIAATETEPAIPALPKFSLEFSGLGVRSEKIEKPALDDKQRLVLDANHPATVLLEAEAFEAQVELVQRDVPDYRKVTLELNGALPSGSLIWDWSYKADRTTARDSEGYGRAGTLLRIKGEKESTLGIATGREVWMRHGPRIISAFCLDDQLAMEEREFYGQPVAKYRLAELSHTSTIKRDGKNEKFDQKLGPSGNLHRHLFIVAENLPPPRDKQPFPDLRIGEGSGVVEYRIRARGAEKDFRNSDELKQAWTAYNEAVGAKSADVITDQKETKVEGLLVLAIIRNRSEPGPQPFVLAESEGAWNLLYGDMRGKFMIARQLAESRAPSSDNEGDVGEDGEWESVSDAFTPEKIHLVVDLQNTREAIKSINATLALNNEIVPYGENPEAPSPIILTPDPNQPTIYRSPPIHLINAGHVNNPERSEGDILLEVKKGDVLKARVQSDSGYFLQPTTATAKVYSTPGQLNAHWKEAVKTAADLAGEPIEDWNRVLNGQAGAVTNIISTEFAVVAAKEGLLRTLISQVVIYAESNDVVIPYSAWLKGSPSGGIRSLKVSIGDHAAMLLLRDEFIRMMNEQLADWNRNQTPPKMRAIYESQKHALANRQSPLSFVKIPIRSLPEYEEGPQSLADRTRLHLSENKTWWLVLDTVSPHMAGAIRSLGGDDVGRMEDPYLYQLFDPEFLAYKTRVKEDMAYFEQLQWSAFSHAFRQWGPMMRKTISDARAINNGDVNGLLKLTGLGFEPVVARLVPKMMKSQIDAASQRSAWVPDYLARAHVKSLGVLGSAAKAQQEYADIDTTVMLAAAAVATMPLGGGGIWSALITAAVSGADLAYTVYTDVIGNEARRKDLEFEVGAGAVLGANRAADTESKILGDLEQAFSVVGATFGMGVDGAAFVRTARALKTAKLVEESGRLLKHIDFADPAALRALSKQDKSLLAEMIRRSEEFAVQGRFGEFPEEFAEINRNRKSILKALDGSEGFTDEALELTNRRREILANAGDQPKTTWRDQDFKEADLALETKIAKNKDEIADLEEKAKDILNKHPEGTLPPPRSADAKKLSELDENVRKLRNENGDFAQRRDVISNYRRPHAKLPARQAEILRGEGLPPSRAEFGQLREARERARAGRAPATGDGLERVDLDSAKERIDDLTKSTREKIDDLVTRNPAPGSADARALQDARARLDDLTETRADIDDLAGTLRSDIRTEIPMDDATFLRGERSALSAVDEAKVVDAIVESNGDWSTLVKKAEGSPDDQLLMQKIHQWRRDKMNEVLFESMREAEKTLGLPEGSIKPSAFGTTNLTSDYDVSINPPKLTGPGRGPELAVRRFQEKTRKLLGGRESGAVVDTNVYTDPIYTIFKGSGLEGEIAGLTSKQVDTSRQFLLQQMANVKYRTPGQWKKLRERVLEGVPAESRKAVSDILDQAEGANKLAKARVAETLKARGIENPSAAQRLRANNDLYADTLESIDGYKQLIDGLKGASEGKFPASQVPLPGFLRKPEMERALGEAERLMKSGDPELVAKGGEILDDLTNRAVLNMRNKQGEALYYAAEAYQTEAAINHVVKELQEPPKKLVNAESIMSGKHNLEPPKQPLSPDDYVNSYFENGGNLVKELNAKNVLDETGGIKPGHEYNDKAATKASKYFIRQLDAASMAKLDMNAVKVPGFPDDFTLKQLVEATVELEKNRSNLPKFKDVLKKYNMTSEQYLDRVIKAQEKLDTDLMGISILPSIANDLRAAESSAEMAVSNYFRSGGKKFNNPTKLVRHGVIALGKELLKTREDYQASHGNQLAELEQTATSGRFLTESQNAELTRLRKVAAAQQALEDSGTAARLSGMPPVDLDRLVGDLSKESDVATARNEAAARIQKATRERLAANPPSIDAPSAAPIPESIRRSLKLGESNTSLTPVELGKHLEAAGVHVSERSGDSIDSLGSQLEANRQVLVKISNPNATDETKVSWIRVHDVNADRVIADDPVSGEPVLYSPEIFQSLTSNQKSLLIGDPYRAPDGAYQNPPITLETKLNLNEALPLPDGGLAP